MYNHKITAFPQQACISKEYFPKGIMKTGREQPRRDFLRKFHSIIFGQLKQNAYLYSVNNTQDVKRHHHYGRTDV